MTLPITGPAPDFQPETNEGPISFHVWMGHVWASLFSHPKHFTLGCTIELGATAHLIPAFAKRKSKFVGISADTMRRDEGWMADLENVGGRTLNDPPIAGRRL